jgi:hypothetical protein
LLGSALRVALLCTPLQAEPCKIPELQSPSDGVRRNNKLVIENRCLVHPSLSSSDIRRQRFFGFFSCVVLMLALDVIAQDENEDAPHRPGEHVPQKWSNHGFVHP